jgi:ABC-type lipoprotein export system ATPase subunit
MFRLRSHFDAAGKSNWALQMSRDDRHAFLEVEGLSKSYGDAATGVNAVRDVSFVAYRGERLALLGKSGSGKSTLLNLIAGMDRPTSGRICVADQSLSEMSPAAIADYRRDCVGMVFQAYNLVPWRTALQNVELPMVFAGRPRVDRETAARRALAEVGLASRAEHVPSQLSGGEQQRVAIARALMNGPQLLLADEPTGNLDSVTAVEIIELLDRVAQQSHMTTILVTHDEALAHRFTTRVLRMKDGRLDCDSGAERA